MTKPMLSLKEKKKAKAQEYDKVFDAAIAAIDALRTIVGENSAAVQKLRDIDRALELLEQHHETLDEVVDDLTEIDDIARNIDDCTSNISSYTGDLADLRESVVNECLELLGPENDA